MSTNRGPGQSRPTIRFVYLSPSDKPFVPVYKENLERGVSALQHWFAEKLGGFTFAVSEPDIVEWYQTDHPASWYASNPSPDSSRNWFWESVLEDAFSLTGADFDQPNHHWMFYMDADPGCGQAMGAASGVALVGANDLRGLTGEKYVPLCPDEPVWSFPWERWVGGMGHELGHTLGLDHPADSPGGNEDRTLMYWGYLDFPNTYLRISDEKSLLESGFFFDGVPVE